MAEQTNYWKFHCDKNASDCKQCLHNGKLSMNYGNFKQAYIRDLSTSVLQKFPSISFETIARV